ncbi:Meiotically up-regulated gene protein like [Verticillium longisporum]|nr:Meiotically up-regulated gene protein like [Verticillium longisporum]KAG7138667.1 Meiotically up-regulated gene protein like [Verticillium longisporum]CRK26095.1 hypothetical protein BN1723_003393 [Verticillium longisporum]
MALLVGYSSDEDDEENVQVEAVKTEPANAPFKSTEPEPTPSSSLPPQPQAPAPEEPPIGPIQQHSVPLGPSLPDADAPSYLPEPSQSPSSPSAPQHAATARPASPYTASRALLRDLTLPPTPNLDIPPSPPGSPPPALTAKTQQFLDLKSKGVHFNAKLTASAALRNPALMDKLLGFVGLGHDDDPRAQYVTTLSAGTWDPTGAAADGDGDGGRGRGFPDWAFRGPLRLSQERARKEREAERSAGKRTGVDFVAASSGGGTPASGNEAGGLRGSKRKAGAW